MAASLTTAAHSVKAAKPATKTVTFGGYALNVPAGWPVYDLTKNPSQCVRYDQHAVYLGTPGPNPDCPPDAVGRVDTISIGQDPGTAAILPGTAASPARTGDRKSAAQGSQQAAAPGTIVQDPDLHELALAMPAASPQVGATYGTDPGATEQILATIHPDGARQAPALKGVQPSAPPRTGDSFHVSRHPVIVQEPAAVQAPAQPKARPRAQAPAERKAPRAAKGKGGTPAWPTVTTTPTGIPSSWLPPSDRPAPPAPKPTGPAPKPTPKPTGPVLTSNPAPAPPATSGGTLAGFDTCGAPSLPVMKAWRAKYAATAIYIGGQMMGCGQSNLSASWVSQAKAQGWSLMPTFVGLQAPCNSFSGKINPKQAASQGTAAANQAIADANSYGMGSGTPIYYDMEAYDNSNAGCKSAVLTFLDGWDRQLAAQHYVSGLYSSAASGIVDVQAAGTVSGHAMAKPKAVWFALWDNKSNLNGTGYLNSTVWPLGSRSKQYSGNQTVKVGGYSLEIDADLVGSAVVHS